MQIITFWLILLRERLVSEYSEENYIHPKKITPPTFLGRIATSFGNRWIFQNPPPPPKILQKPTVTVDGDRFSTSKVYLEKNTHTSMMLKTYQSWRM